MIIRYPIRSNSIHANFIYLACKCQWIMRATLNTIVVIAGISTLLNYSCTFCLPSIKNYKLAERKSRVMYVNVFFVFELNNSCKVRKLFGSTHHYVIGSEAVCLCRVPRCFQLTNRRSHRDNKLVRLPTGHFSTTASSSLLRLLL